MDVSSNAYNINAGRYFSHFKLYLNYISFPENKIKAKVHEYPLTSWQKLIGNVATLQTSHQIYLIDKISNVNTNLIITINAINISGVIVKIVPYVITIE